MRVLITGHVGFIGQNLTVHLEDRGFDVFGIDTASPVAGERVDIRDAKALERAFTKVKPDAVIHLAALASVPRCESRPEDAMDINETGTRVVARVSARHGSRLVFMSSAAVYGNPVLLPTPVAAPQQPVNVYGETKVLGERIVREESEGDAVIFRLFNAYGERCDRSYVVPDLIRKALSGLNPIPMQGLGTEARDFIYIQDVVAALRRATETEVSGTYNLGTGLCTDIDSLARLVVRELGLTQVALRFEDSSRLGDFRVSWADLSDGNRLPGWAPRWSLADGIHNTVAYYVARMKSSTERTRGRLVVADDAPGFLAGIPDPIGELALPMATAAPARRATPRGSAERLVTRP